MFELSVACKYLIPRWRQLSVSIISLISILVIALVVWLIIVFFSVTDGLEKNWVQKLTVLTAPVRITPTDAYYHSYYYQIDQFSEASNYALKTIKDKLDSQLVNPYDPEFDQELPSYLPAPDLTADGIPKDLVKFAYQAIDEIKDVSGLSAKDYALTSTHLQLMLDRPNLFTQSQHSQNDTVQSSLNYPVYLGSFEQSNAQFAHTLLPIETKDLNNLLFSFNRLDSRSLDSKEERASSTSQNLSSALKQFFEVVHVKELKPRSARGWTIPPYLIPKQANWQVVALIKNQRLYRVFVPQTLDERSTLLNTLQEEGLEAIRAELIIRDGQRFIRVGSTEEQDLPLQIPLTLSHTTSFKALMDEHSIAKVKLIDYLRFEVEISIQNTLLRGFVFFRGLEIASLDKQVIQNESFPFWMYAFKSTGHPDTLILPHSELMGQGIILPKSFRDAHVLIGDKGSLSYLSPTASMIEEQQIPVFVAGFYDPGIIPIGGKFILANPEVTSLIRDSHPVDDRSSPTNGINVRFDSLKDAQKIKALLQQKFKEKGIQNYWQVQTYQEYDFTQEIMRELQSQKNLFMLIAVVIIIVACSNIISMLIILVNDKKLEIGILRSMGATSKSIACIFGLAGALIGVTGSVIGITAAMVTLKYLNHLIYALSYLQGHEMFGRTLHGQVMPSHISLEALTFVMITTVCLSLLAGLVPAIKACLIRPSEILRAGAG